MEETISFIIGEIINDVVKDNEMFNFSETSQHLLNIEEDMPPEVCCKINSPEFTPHDVFSDLSFNIENAELAENDQEESRIEAGTQTSQSLLKFIFMDTAAQTSLHNLSNFNWQQNQPLDAEALHQRFGLGSEISIHPVGRTTNGDLEEQEVEKCTHDQVVPDGGGSSDNQPMRLKIRRIGLSKRARMDSLHKRS